MRLEHLERPIKKISPEVRREILLALEEIKRENEKDPHAPPLKFSEMIAAVEKRTDYTQRRIQEVLGPRL